jgi:hypothetical protein
MKFDIKSAIIFAVIVNAVSFTVNAILNYTNHLYSYELIMLTFLLGYVYGIYHLVLRFKKQLTAYQQDIAKTNIEK